MTIPLFTPSFFITDDGRLLRVDVQNCQSSMAVSTCLIVLGFPSPPLAGAVGATRAICIRFSFVIHLSGRMYTFALLEF